MTEAERALLECVMSVDFRSEDVPLLRAAVNAERLPSEAKRLWMDAYKNRVRASRALQDICEHFQELRSVDVGPWRIEASAELEAE